MAQYCCAFWVKVYLQLCCSSGALNDVLVFQAACATSDSRTNDYLLSNCFSRENDEPCCYSVLQVCSALSFSGTCVVACVPSGGVDQKWDVRTNIGVFQNYSQGAKNNFEALQFYVLLVCTEKRWREKLTMLYNKRQSQKTYCLNLEILQYI